MKAEQQKTGYFFLTLLRVAIGWHFLYEGLTKAFDPGWTAAGYLQSATGPFAGFYHMLAGNETMLGIVNMVNIWALILIGLGLILGLFTRISQIAGILLLATYYMSHPPVFSDPGFFREGSYFLVSKDLIEMLALLLLMFFPTGKFLGFDGMLSAYFRKPVHKMDHGQPGFENVPGNEPGFRRREILKHLATLPFVGIVAFAAIKRIRMYSMEEKNLVDATAGATQRFVQQIQAGSNDAALKDLKGKLFTSETDKLTGKLPTAMLGNMETSRIILGGNLLSGYAHSRDLIYVSSLVLHYNQKDRIFRTLMLAEQAGVNTLLSNPVVMPLMEEYWKEGYGNIQFISDCAGLDYSGGTIKPLPFDEYMDIVKNAVDKGANACYIQGETADYYIGNDQADKIVKVMDYIRSQGLSVGIGAHKIETIKKCVKLGIEHDFWMKTLHTHDYWSAKHPTWHDNMYCFDPNETIAFMETLDKPWIAFKTLAAGALKPEEAFPYVFNKGADFLCVGMYDFQIIDDVNIALNALGNVSDRTRPWRA